MKTAPYGEWISPITTDLIVADTVRLSQPSIENRIVYWVEDRPAEDGRGVLVRWTESEGCRDLVPVLFSVRSRVHEYGGGSYLAVGGRHWFVNERDQNIYEAFLNKDPIQITDTATRRYADLVFDVHHDRLICVVEDHSPTDEPFNCLVAVSLADGKETVLVEGHDFYSNPRLDPEGRRLTWLSWDHPNLPWDSTQPWLAVIKADGSLDDVTPIPVGDDVSVFCPRWSPNGDLYLVSDATDWWNLYRFEDGAMQPVCKQAAEFGLPQWLFGMSTYAFSSESRIICAYTRDGLWHLCSLDTNTAELTELDLPWTAVEHVAADNGCAVLIAGAPDQPRSLVLLDLVTGANEILRVSNKVTNDNGYVSTPKAISYPTGGGEKSHALYYAPANKDYVGPEDELPPLLVICHGGPTAATNTAQKLGIQYWTSRGFAVLDVNYRGSTGFGRSYRQKLYGAWGVADVEDCINGSKYLADQGKVDANRLAISGGSAGGFTVLCALTFHDTFRVGGSHFGIGDLETMFDDTHKFESRYDHWLLGPRSESGQLLIERSPARHADLLNCPVIFFQGLEDKVVPPSQSEIMVETLKKNGLPVAYIAFPNEAHGFRRAESIRASIEGELAFFGKILGFKPADPLPDIPIYNLPKNA